jgi:hypothetical protein
MVVLKRACALLGLPLLAAGLAACASTTSTAAFKGEEHAVAQAIANLRSDATADNERKVCADDLASAVVARLNTARGGCAQAVKNQLAEVDNFEVSVQSVQVKSVGMHATASARVASIQAGKTGLSTLALVKEGGKWKISGLG